ncbi:MAG: hypothetical protein ABSB28_08785 [Candidatus Bathyarchaeia archaeon]
MNEEELKKIWWNILQKKGCPIQEVEIGSRRYLTTNYRRTEPVGSSEARALKT